MATIMQVFTDWLWDEKFWLHSGHTWKDFENPPPGVYYPLERHLLLPSILIGVALLGVRYVYERFLVVPFALYMGLTFRKVYAIEKNPKLETVFAKTKFIDKNQVEELAKKTSLTERQVERWFRHRRCRDMTGKMRKFRECSWHFVFYTASFFGGLYVLWDKPYFWDSKYCWIDHLRQHVPNDVYWYYLVELGFYWCLVFTMLTDHKRKDFTEMAIHHVVTILLIYFSFGCNCVRIGTLVLLVHDAVDFWMAAAKMAHYVKKAKLTDTLFGIFIVVWIITRLYLYPVRVVWSASVQSLDYIPKWPGYWPLNIMLWSLQVLHILWTYMILRILATKFAGNKKAKDVRSDTESSTGEEEEEEEDVTMETMANGSSSMKKSSHTESRKIRRA